MRNSEHALDNNFRIDNDRPLGMENRLKAIFDEDEAIKSRTNFYHNAYSDVKKIDGPGVHPSDNRMWAVGDNYAAGKKSFDLLALEQTGSGSATRSIALSTGRSLENYWGSSYSGNSNNPSGSITNLSEAFDILIGTSRGTPTGATGQVQTTTDLKTMLQQSTLDSYIDDLKTIQRKISSTDKNVLDEYLTRVREVEQKVNGKAPASALVNSGTCPSLSKPEEGNHFNYQQRLDIYSDIIIAAFCAYRTRCISIAIHDNWNKTGHKVDYKAALPNIPNSMKNNFTYHELSHGIAGGNAQEKKDAFFEVDKMRLGFFVKIAKALSRMNDSNGLSILDNSMIRFGAAYSTRGTGGDGGGGGHESGHNTTLSIGGFGGKVKTGQILDNKGAHLSNINLSLLKAMGVNINSFGLSDGKGISANDVSKA